MKHCKYCGKEISDDATFCKFCGKSLQAPAAAAPVSQPAPKKDGSGSNGIWVPIIVVLIAIVVLVAFLLKPSSEKDPTKSGQEVTQSSKEDKDVKNSSVSDQTQPPAQSQPEATQPQPSETQTPPTQPPAETKPEPSTEAPTKPRQIKVPAVGSYVSFGQYEQDGYSWNGKEPIGWLVLQTEGTRAWLISAYCLENIRFQEKFMDVTWDNSDIRKWLNTDFYNEAFTIEEMRAIEKVNLTTPENSIYHTPGGKMTSDYVWLLSLEEAKAFNLSTCEMTPYTSSKINNGTTTAPWWLRSPGSFTNYAAYVTSYGEIYDAGQCVDREIYAARPAMWVDFAKLDVDYTPWYAGN